MEDFHGIFWIKDLGEKGGFWDQRSWVSNFEFHEVKECIDLCGVLSYMYSTYYADTLPCRLLKHVKTADDVFPLLRPPPFPPRSQSC